MSALDPKKTYKNLKKKGFIDSTTKSVDHKHVDFFHNKKLDAYRQLQVKATSPF